MAFQLDKLKPLLTEDGQACDMQRHYRFQGTIFQESKASMLSVTMANCATRWQHWIYDG